MKQLLQSLSEDDFRQKIIIPIVRQWGAFKVEDWCGPGEKGKDILYVYEGGIFRENIVGGILIKNEGNIKKSGTPKKNITTIKVQAEEALSTTIPDPLDNTRSTSLQELYVITGYNLNREARDYICSVCRKTLPYIRIIDGDMVVKKITEMMGRDYLNFSVDSFAQFCASLPALVDTRNGSLMRLGTTEENHITPN